MIGLRDQYVARFGALPAVKHAAPHDGAFGDDEVARAGAARTPTIRVTCIGLRGTVDICGEAAGTLIWAAYVVARSPDRVGEGQDSAGDIAALIALRIAAELEEGAGFSESLARPERVTARNLFASSRGAAKGHVIWLVSWDQDVLLPRDGLDAILNDLATVATDFDLNGETDPEASSNQTSTLNTNLDEVP